MIKKLRIALIFAVLSAVVFSASAFAGAGEIIISGADTYTSNIEDVKKVDSTITVSSVKSLDGSKNGINVCGFGITSNEYLKTNLSDGIWFKYEFACEKAGYYEISIETETLGGMESMYNYGVDDKIYDVSPETTGGERVHSSQYLFYIDEGTHTFTYSINSIAKDFTCVYGNFFEAKLTNVGEKIESLIAKIDGIGTVTAESEETVNLCRKMYDELGDAARKLITNYDKLTAAEKIISNIKSGIPMTPIELQPGSYSSKSSELSYSIDTAYFKKEQVGQFVAKNLPAGGLSITYNFDVLLPGTYRLDLSAARYDNVYMSDYAVSVDGGEKYDIDDETIDVNTSHPNGGKYSEYLGKYKTKLLFDLEQGKHTLTFYITSERVTNDSKVYVFMEYLRFVLEEDLSDVKFSESVSYGEIGSAAASKLIYKGAKSGSEIAEENLSGTGAVVNYSTDKADVVEIGSDGNIKFNNFGETEITANVSYNEKSFKPKLTARTTVDGIYIGETVFADKNGDITSLSAASGKLTAKTAYVNTNGGSQTIYTVLAVYRDGVLEAYKKQENTLVASGDMETTIDSFTYADGMTAQLFVWSNENVPALMSAPEEIK